MDFTLKYLSLLKKVLLNEIYPENELRIFLLAEGAVKKKWSPFSRKVDFEKLHHIRRYFPDEFEDLKRSRIEGELLKVNTPHLVYADTMIGRKRLDNIEACIRVILEEKITGDLMECGIWRGGAGIFMKAYLETHQKSERTVWLADSFDGVPESTLEIDKPVDLSKKAYPGLAISKDEVINNFNKYEVSLDGVRFLEGWFKDTLPSAPIKELALLRLDGDLYESTMDVLKALYHKVSIGGFVIIDDFKALSQCEEAVQEFRSNHNITEPIHKIDSMAVYWQKQVL